MAGYSSTPLARKLGYKPGMRAHWIGAPKAYRALLGDGLEGVTVARKADGADLVHVFANARGALIEALTALRGAIDVDGMVWVSWYKKAAKLPTEITEDLIREIALPMGWVDVKVCAVDEQWSGLKLVIRKEQRNQLRT